MSYNTVQNSLTTGFLLASAGSTFNGNINVNSTLFVNNENRNSTEEVKELVLTPSNQLVMRPYKISDVEIINDSFAMCSAQWEVVPPVTITIPVIDAIVYAVTAPIGSNTVGRIISNHVYQIRANNTDDIYASNIVTETVPSNGLDKGLYLFIPGTVPARYYSITRPLRFIKSSSGITGNGLSFELKFVIIYITLFFFECKELFDFSIINYREIESGIILFIYFHKNIFYFLS